GGGRTEWEEGAGIPSRAFLVIRIVEEVLNWVEGIVRPLALEGGAGRRAKDLLQGVVAVDEVAQREHQAVIVVVEILLVLIAGKDAPTAIALVVGLFAIEPADR